MQIRVYQAKDETGVITLWRAAGLTVPHNNPVLDIQRKLAHSPELFLVGEEQGVIIASVMGGYDGHRGWINYLAVQPDKQGSGIGRQMMQEIEKLLSARGCAKINLQVRDSNAAAIQFYQSLGYGTDAVLSLGKRLVTDTAADT